MVAERELNRERLAMQQMKPFKLSDWKNRRIALLNCLASIVNIHIHPQWLLRTDASPRRVSDLLETYLPHKVNYHRPVIAFHHLYKSLSRRCCRSGIGCAGATVINAEAIGVNLVLRRTSKGWKWGPSALLLHARNCHMSTEKMVKGGACRRKATIVSECEGQAVTEMQCFFRFAVFLRWG